MSQCKYCGEEVKDRREAECRKGIDREKVIKGLKACSIAVECQNTCPYYDADDCHILYADAAALIESAPSKAGRMKIAPIIYYKRREFMGNSVIGWLACGCCGKDMDTSDHYCRHCGTEVDWDAKDLAWRRYETGGTSP